MTIFTPYTSSPPDPNYLGYSKSPDAIKPNTGVGKALEGVGEMWETGVKGWDTMEKKNLEDEANKAFMAANQEEVTRLEEVHRKISGGQVPGQAAPVQTDSTGKPIPFTEDETQKPVGPFRREDSAEEPLPPAATKQINYLQKISQAGINGRMTGTGVQMNGEAILSDLLQRYPSRASEIRSLAAKHGFGEGRYANQLRTEINQFQQQVSAKDNRDETWENTNRDWLIGTPELPGIDPDYFKRPKEVRRAPEARDYYQSKIGNVEAIKKYNELEKSSIELRAARSKKEDVVIDTKRLYTNEISVDYGISFTALMGRMGFKGVDSVEKFMEAWKSDPRSNDPAQREILGQQLEQFKVSQIDKWTRKASRDTIGKDTVLSLIKKDGMDEAHGVVLASIASFQRMIDAKGSDASFAAASADARVATGFTDLKHRKMIESNPSLAGIEAWRKIVGEQVWGQQYINAEGAVRMPVDNAMRLALDVTTNALGTGTPDPRTGQPQTVTTILQKYSHDWEINGKGGQVKPQDLSALMDRIKSNLMNDKMPIETSIKFAKSVFTDHALFSQLKGTDKQKFLSQYASPAVTERIYNLGDPELIDNYKRWLNNAVVATAHETASNYNAVVNRGTSPGTTGTAFDATPYFNLTFDPKTNRIEGSIASNDKVYSDVGTTPTRYGSIVNQLKTVRSTVDKLNQTIGIIAPVLQKEKTTISPEITSLLQSMGIKIKVEEGAKPPASLPIKNNADSVYRNSPPTLQMQTPASGVKAPGFADENLPPSGNVGTIDAFLANPASVMKAPVKAEGGNTKKKSINLSDSDWMNISVDNIPEGMSAKDFIKVLQQRDKQRP